MPSMVKMTPPPQYFANKYENLYNSVDDSNDLLIVEESISLRIKNSAISEVLKIIPTLVTHGHLTNSSNLHSLTNNKGQTR